MADPIPGNPGVNVTFATPSRLRLFDIFSAATREKMIWALMGGLLIYTVIRGIIAAGTKSLWYDELVTLAVAAQPTVQGVWEALLKAFDAHPPVFYLIERVSLKLPLNEQVALRLPSVLAMTCTVACVLIYTTKRWKSSWLAFLSATLFLSTGLYREYLAEARPYS